MVESVCKLVYAGLVRLVRATDVMWPGMDRQLPEQNLSLYVAHELLGQGYTAMTEWPFNQKEHIDLVAYHSVDRTLVLAESKRAWNRSLELDWLCEDVARLEQAAKSLEAWTSKGSGKWQRIDPLTVVGVALVGSIDETCLDPDKPRRGRVNDALSSLISKVGRFDRIAHNDRQNAYVLHYAVWQIPVS